MAYGGRPGLPPSERLRTILSLSARILLLCFAVAAIGARSPLADGERKGEGSRPAMASTTSTLATTLTPSVAGMPVSSGPIEEPADGGALRIRITGVINPVLALFVENAVKEAESQDCSLLLVEMDTPGGLMSSMRQIIQAIMNSSVPVAVYVSPQGARAASAGAFILASAHVALMAPGTNVGAAHPVSIGFGSGKEEQKTDVMSAKVTNDAVAYFRSLLDQRGRNVTWAERAVRKSESITAQQALAQDIIDGVAVNRREALERCAGQVVIVSGGRRIRLPRIAGLPQEFSMTWRERLLAHVADPSVAYMLLMLGALAVVYEVTHPGIGLPGVVGVLSLGLAFYALQIFPISGTGVVLLLFGLIFLFLETQVPSAGILTVGGVACLAIGSFMLIDSPLPSLRVPWKIIASVTGSIAAFFVFVVGKAVADQLRPVVTGVEAMVGLEARVDERIDGKGGTVHLGGEIWRARIEGREAVATGRKVIIDRVEGLTLWVHPVDDEGTETNRKEG